MEKIGMSLYSTVEIRKLESFARDGGLDSDTLMARAGEAAFIELNKRWPKVKKIVVLCGVGNNGGDGYTVASLAKQAKMDVKVLYFADGKRLTSATARAKLRCEKLGIAMVPFAADELRGYELLVDAIFGIDFRGQLPIDSRQAIGNINQSNIPILALDIPSGVNADDGSVSTEAICADVTITFIGRKIGLYVGVARNYRGNVICHDLGIAKNLFHLVKPALRILNLEEELKLLVPRKRTSHKGDHGCVLVVGGDHGMGGAARIAAEGALRAGAGYVVVATRREHVSAINAARPEIMVHGIDSPEELVPLFKMATVIVLGSGLGRKSWGKSLFQLALASDKPMVIDGDGLTLLAMAEVIKDNWVLTPHPGEAARLLNIEVSKVQANRLEASQGIIRKYGGVCVLKGADSLVSTAGQMSALCDAGNPGMASAGMGDLLGGVIAGFLAQKVDIFGAAKLGTVVHATAGDLVAKCHGEIGMVALDLIPFMRKVIAKNKKQLNAYEYNE